MFPKHNGFPTISESFALNLMIFVPLTNRSLLAPYNANLNRNFFSLTVKLSEYFFSAVYVVSSNPYVGPSPMIKISFFFLPTC